jgi:hypothetical protein
MTSFNYNSFFNKQILDGADSISVAVRRLSDEDFEVLCSECQVRESKTINDSFRTEAERSYGLIPLEDFKKMASDIYDEILNVAEKHKDIPEAYMSVGAGGDGHYYVQVCYMKMYSRDDREQLVVEVLGQRKGKILAKKARTQKEKKNPSVPKTMMIDGVEYLLTPKG